MPPEIPQPWSDFLAGLDGQLHSRLELHCLGGFVLAMRHGLLRPTADVDVLEVRPNVNLDALAGRGSEAHKRHGVYLQRVTVLEAYPENYEDRLVDMFAGAFRYLRLLALEPYDLALTKLGRNSARDREDLLHLAAAVPLDIHTHRSRYQDEMRPYLGNPNREDLTLELWEEMILESRRTRVG